MTTSTANLTPGSVINLVKATPGTTMVTNTCTVTWVAGGKKPASTAAASPSGGIVLFRLTHLNNDDQDVPTVQGSGTITLTVVDVNTVTQLTSMALIGVFDTTAVATVPTEYYYACPLTEGVFTVVTTVSAGDSDLIVYALDALYLPASPFNHPTIAA